MKIKSKISIILIFIIVISLITSTYFLYKKLTKDEMRVVGTRENLEKIYNYKTIDTSKIEKIISKAKKNIVINGTMDYSNNDICVLDENVADTFKIHNELIFSIQNNEVVVTNKSALKVINRLRFEDEKVTAEGILLHDSKLIVIGQKEEFASQNKNYSTYVDIYDISDSAKIIKIKEFNISKRYCTARIINKKLYVISNGELKKDYNENIINNYMEDNSVIDIDFNNIYYYKNQYSRNELVISKLDLENSSIDFDVKGYLLNTRKIYIKDNNIYVLEEIVGLKNSWKVLDRKSDRDKDSGIDNTLSYRVSKLQVNDEGEINYIASKDFKGNLLKDNFMNEYGSKFRIGILEKKGLNVYVLDENMKKIYNTKAIKNTSDAYKIKYFGNKALVLSNNLETNEILINFNENSVEEIELSSNILDVYPYDENKLLVFNFAKENNGIIGMKLGLYDISNVKNIVKYDEIIIGDNIRKSSILSNNNSIIMNGNIIAIPINECKYSTKINEAFSSIEENIKSYKTTFESNTAEGYIVYNLNEEYKFDSKGMVLHSKGLMSDTKQSSVLSLKGNIADNILYTISKKMIKMNKIENLEEVGTIEI